MEVTDKDIMMVVVFFLIGFVIYWAKAIATGTEKPWRITLARAILNGFTALCVGVVLIWFNIPALAIIGLASLFGTLGSEILIVWVKTIVENQIEDIKLIKEKVENESE